MRYQVLQDYKGRYREEVIQLVTGQEADLPEDTAAWINRDRPGTLAEKPVNVPAPRRAKGLTRQVTQADNREVQNGEAG